jgi:hypothetical protein
MDAGRTISAAALAIVVACVGDVRGPADDLAVSAELAGSSAIFDYSTDPNNNAVVELRRLSRNGACTATLITPNVLITAEHCLLDQTEASVGWRNWADHAARFGPCADNGTPGVVGGLCRAESMHSASEKSDDERYRVCAINYPPLSDVALVRLNRLIPPALAVPQRVLRPTTPPPASWAGQPFRLFGHTHARTTVLRELPFLAPTTPSAWAPAAASIPFPGIPRV